MCCIRKISPPAKPRKPSAPASASPAAVAGDEAPARFALALGCAGWGAGQLEDELRQNAWLVVDSDDAIVFGDAHHDKWATAIRALGFEPSQLMGDAGNA
ncbi:MAG TPA: YqgE/AlgH family protein [Terricaulis sp.]|nr:YqgE/AlgH family protein [Terricaulis sp.]